MIVRYCRFSEELNVLWKNSIEKFLKPFKYSDEYLNYYFLKIIKNKTKVHLLVHHIQIKNFHFSQSDNCDGNEISGKSFEQNPDCNFNIDEDNEKSKITKNENYERPDNEQVKQKYVESVENSNSQNNSFGNEKRKIFLQFSEPVSKQVYNTNSGYYDEICLRRPIITMTFTDAISKKTIIYIKMFDSITNKLIAELPLPLNIIPFDKKVSSKFRMINKFDEDINKDTDPSLIKRSLSIQKNEIENNLMMKAENESENNLIDFDVFEKGNINADTNDNSNNAKNCKIKKNIPKIKLFLLIHLSTFGQLPFHAQKGTLLKHLKDATRINAKSFGNRKDSKDKSLSLNSIITPTQHSSSQEKYSISASNSTPNQHRIPKTYDFDIFNSDRVNSNLNINENSNTTSEYTESNDDSSSEVVETLFIDNFSDQKDQQPKETDEQIQKTDKFIDDFAKVPHSHHHSHHRHRHETNSRSHRHSRQHRHHTHSNQNNQLDQQNHLSDDQKETTSYSQFNGKKHKKALIKVGSCGDIPAQCLLTDILVK